MITSYTRADQLISQERDGVKSYYLYDGFDSVRMFVNDECEITDTYTYDAFGNLLSSTGDTENSFLYRGEQYHSFIGLYYLTLKSFHRLSLISMMKIIYSLFHRGLTHCHISTSVRRTKNLCFLI